MTNYEDLDTFEVQRLARQGDKNAMFEMAWRFELLPDEENNSVGRCAWQDYWLDKAANKGHIEAKGQYARYLVRDCIINAEDRQKAMRLFQSLADDFDAGKLSKEQEDEGIDAKLWLGVMLCEGYHTKRDPIQGTELIKAAESLTNGFKGFGFNIMSMLGELYVTGLAQVGGEPSIADLEQGIKYLDMAIQSFNHEKNDPRKLDLIKQLFEIQKKRIVTKMELRASTGKENTYYAGAEEERKKYMEPSSDAVRKRLKADKEASAHLRQRLTQEGW